MLIKTGFTERGFPDDGGDDNGNSEAIDMGDLLGKAIALVKQVNLFCSPFDLLR